jgi:hypothetical protein
VCAPEVKKKFQTCEMEKRCTAENYFVNEFRELMEARNAINMRDVLWRRRLAGVFARPGETEKTPAGRLRHKKTARLNESRA